MAQWWHGGHAKIVYGGQGVLADVCFRRLQRPGPVVNLRLEYSTATEDGEQGVPLDQEMRQRSHNPDGLFEDFNPSVGLCDCEQSPTL